MTRTIPDPVDPNDPTQTMNPTDPDPNDPDYTDDPKSRGTRRTD